MPLLPESRRFPRWVIKGFFEQLIEEGEDLLGVLRKLRKPVDVGGRRIAFQLKDPREIEVPPSNVNTPKRWVLFLEPKSVPKNSQVT